MTPESSSSKEPHEVIDDLVHLLENKTKYSSRASDILDSIEFAEIVGYGEIALSSIARYVNTPNYGWVARLAFQRITSNLEDPVVYPANLNVSLEECQMIDKRWLTINGYISPL